MSARSIARQVPASLAETLAIYEDRRKLSQSSASAKPVSSPTYPEVVQYQVGAIYNRTLPSLHFLRWRPLYHLQAPAGWMNDPCGPGYDPTTGLYHLFFQWNPRRNEYGAVAWGSICWGHAVSTDMVNWSIHGKPSIRPGAWYDKEGCFTGCMIPTGLDGKPGMTVFYTGVSRLPLHYTLPYVNRTETVAVMQPSTSGDWAKMRGNPILLEPPQGVGVSGFRDPFVAQWPDVDAMLGQPSGSALYGMISGGIKGRTPTAFLYAINPEKLTQWVYLSTMIDIGLNHNISRWSGDMGINWECANFMTLASSVDGSSRTFIVVGAEGSDSTHPNSTFTEYPQPMTKFPRTERSLQWMCGKLQAGPEIDGKPTPQLAYVSGGRFDHGLMYGVNSFTDPKSGKQIAYGWVTEEDLPQSIVDRQNWSGMISIPRDLSLICINRVIGTLKSDLKEITSFEVEPEGDGSFTIRTLGMSPSSSLDALRKGARQVQVSTSHPLSILSRIGLDVQTCRFEMAASFSLSDHCRRIGFSIYHSQNLEAESATSIYLTTESETLMIDRPDSSQIDPEIHTHTERAPFTLLNISQPDGSIRREYLEIRAFFDESILEVFANNRCTFATRIYPATKRCWGIRFWADDDTGQSSLNAAKAWDGLRADIRVN